MRRSRGGPGRQYGVLRCTVPAWSWSYPRPPRRRTGTAGMAGRTGNTPVVRCTVPAGSYPRHVPARLGRRAGPANCCVSESALVLFLAPVRGDSPCESVAGPAPSRKHRRREKPPFHDLSRSIKSFYS